MDRHPPQVAFVNAGDGSGTLHGHLLVRTSHLHLPRDTRLLSFLLDGCLCFVGGRNKPGSIVRGPSDVNKKLPSVNELGDELVWYSLDMLGKRDFPWSGTIRMRFATKFNLSQSLHT